MDPHPTLTPVTCPHCHCVIGSEDAGGFLHTAIGTVARLEMKHGCGGLVYWNTNLKQALRLFEDIEHRQLIE